MQLEDALLCVKLDHVVSATWCRDAIAGGADMLVTGMQGQDDDAVMALREICKSDDALFILGDDFLKIDHFAADGVHLESAEGPVGQARAVAGLERLVSVSATSADDARLAAAIGVDFVVVDMSVGVAALRAIRSEAALPVFAGVSDVTMADEAVSAGMYRLCVDAGDVDESNVTESFAEYSRLLGRSI
jgi:thiamine monophosphate synthase